MEETQTLMSDETKIIIVLAVLLLIIILENIKISPKKAERIEYIIMFIFCLLLVVGMIFLAVDVIQNPQNY